MAETHLPTRTEQTIRLRDGRRLGYAEFGDSQGHPVFFFHGGGNSRLQRHADDSIVEQLGVRLITTDRPGIGLSDFQPRRKLASWGDDVAELADALGLDRFAVLGYSLGGPHALACAFQVPQRLTLCGVVSGLAPFDRPNGMEGLSPFVRRMFVFARYSHLLAQGPLFIMSRQARRDPGALLDRMFSGAPEYDRMVYAGPGRRENEVAAMIEASRQGSRGLSWELSLIARPWGFPLNALRVPVRLWYGTHDGVTPASMGDYLAREIPDSRLELWPDVSHQGIFEHWREVLQILIEHQPKRDERR